MLSKKVVELLNDQVNKEFYSAYLYLDMSNYYKNEGLDGFANWYKVQAQEERPCSAVHGLYAAEWRSCSAGSYSKTGQGI